ncbi:hypothetical protein F5B19DRAFT_469429 [Rostrohypoxylon terebratum]|nr:hypothetical protein F5B19DRAFT_469429 [Rostrohypoxylon terebratum]
MRPGCQLYLGIQSPCDTDPEWKQLVWYSKRSQALTGSLEKYEEAMIIIGTISTGAVCVFENMKSWKDMTNDCLLRVGPSGQRNIATQYCFSSSRHGHDFIIKNGKFEVFTLSEPQLRILVARHA